MQLVKDGGRYDEFQRHFIVEMIKSIKAEVERLPLPPDQTELVTGSIAFAVAALIDGSASAEANGVELNPILAFAPGSKDAIYNGGNSYMHEYVWGAVDRLFGKPDA